MFGIRCYVERLKYLFRWKLRCLDQHLWVEPLSQRRNMRQQSVRLLVPMSFRLPWQPLWTT